MTFIPELTPETMEESMLHKYKKEALELEVENINLFEALMQSRTLEIYLNCVVEDAVSKGYDIKSFVITKAAIVKQLKARGLDPEELEELTETLFFAVEKAIEEMEAEEKPAPRITKSNKEKQ